MRHYLHMNRTIQVFIMTFLVANTVIARAEFGRKFTREHADSIIAVLNLQNEYPLVYFAPKTATSEEIGPLLLEMMGFEFEVVKVSEPDRIELGSIRIAKTMNLKYSLKQPHYAIRMKKGEAFLKYKKDSFVPAENFYVLIGGTFVNIVQFTLPEEREALYSEQELYRIIEDGGQLVAIKVTDQPPSNE